MNHTARRGLRQRVAEFLDRKAAEADAEASAHGLTIDAPTRYGRTYRDPRYAELRQAREAGCFCVPMCSASHGVLPDDLDRAEAA